MRSYPWYYATLIALILLLLPKEAISQNCGRDAIYGALIDVGKKVSLEDIDSTLGHKDSITVKELVDAFTDFGVESKSYIFSHSDLSTFPKHITVHPNAGQILYIQRTVGLQMGIFELFLKLMTLVRSLSVQFKNAKG